MAASNGRRSETRSSITTKRGIEMGSVAFSDVILLKSLSLKRSPKSYGNGAISPKKYGDNTVDLLVWTKEPAGRK